MADTSGAEKEKTVLKLSEVIIGELDAWDGMLDKSFRRNLNKNKTLAEGTGLYNSVLDEAIDNLKEISQRVCETRLFLIREVISKIH